jgi:hypothetical protein
MKKTGIFLLIALMLFTLPSCVTYTIRHGLDTIAVKEEPPRPKTKLSEIRAEEEAVRAEAERKAEEERKLKENLEAINRAIEKRTELNAYPSDLSLITLPHVYRPANSRTVLNADFTVFKSLLLPLGNEERSPENLSTIYSSIQDINAEFVFLTGSLENRIAFSKLASYDAVTTESGTILFRPELKETTEKSASFILSEGKELALASLSMPLSGFTSDIETWHEAAMLSSQNRIDEISTLSEELNQPAIFALSGEEPSTLDWTRLTSFSYRKEMEWPLSDAILDKGFSDTYRATHYSEETDAGITYENGGISERLDFFYTKGLIEVSSSTLAIGGLSDTEAPVFALMATYIMP